MRTPEWIKKLGSHAGELYVAAELSKRGIPNALLPENFSDDDIIIGKKDGNLLGYIQVKSCHPDRAKTFRLDEKNESWVKAGDEQYVVFVWLGSPGKNEGPAYWIATKKEVGHICISSRPQNPKNTERRFATDQESDLSPSFKWNHRLPHDWRNRWNLLKKYSPPETRSP